MTNQVDKLSMNYIRQQLMLTVAVCLIVLLVMQLRYMDYLLLPAIIGTAFTLVLSLVIGLVWRYVAKSAPDSLPTFFTAVSGFRLLLALAVMFAYYLIDKSTMVAFFLVFMAFYVVSLAHHTIFFARVSNRS